MVRARASGCHCGCNGVGSGGDLADQRSTVARVERHSHADPSCEILILKQRLCWRGFVDQESLAQIQQIVDAATKTIRMEIADAKRHIGVLTEGFRPEPQLIAEGFQMHLDRRHTDDRAYLDEQFRETRAIIQLSYGQIQERVERLTQRVRPLSNTSDSPRSIISS